MTTKNEITHTVNQIALNNEQVDLLKRTICKGADNDEFQLFIGQCNRTGLDPFSGQIHAVKRWSKKDDRYVMTIQTGIDGFRLIADRSKKYYGQLGPFWCGEDGVWKDIWLSKDHPCGAKVGILKDGCTEPFWGVAVWDSFVGLDKEGNVTKFWKQMPEVMLAKCAEGNGLRKAFPQDLSRIYVDEELDHDNPNDGAPSTKRVVDIGESGQRVESRAPVKDTPKAPPAAAAAPTQVAQTIKELTLIDLEKWMKEKQITEKFILDRMHEAETIPADVTTLAGVEEARLVKLNSVPYRKQLAKLWNDANPVPEKKTVDIEPAPKKEEAPATPPPEAAKAPVEPQQPKKGTSEGYQKDPEEAGSQLREIHPDNPYKPEEMDVTTFVMHFPPQHKGKKLADLDPTYLKGFYFRWKPKPYNGKINDADFKLDATLIQWGRETKVTP